MTGETSEIISATPSPSGKLLTRWGTILGSLGCGLGLVGFLVGIYDQPDGKGAMEAIQPIPGYPPAQSFVAAPSYAEIDSRVHGANSTWRSEFASLQQDNPQLFDLVVRTAEMKAAALQDRLRTRAFDGAPPAVPHPVDQRTAESCLVCHGNGMVLAGRIATKMSHVMMSNCTQCHIEQESSVPSSTATTPAVASQGERPPWPPGNSFDGVKRAGLGIRLLPGLPPTIPHTLHMREDCSSCHGLIARPGLRTTHPWLQNCRQCHAAPMELESPPLPMLTQAFPTGQFGVRDE